MTQMFIRIKKSKYLWYILLAIIILIYIFAEFHTLFTKVPRLRSYLAHDFLRSFPSINYLMESFDIRHLRFYHWNQFASAGSPSIAEIGTYYFPNYLLKPLYAINNHFIPLKVYQWYTLSHYLVAGIGFYIFIKSKIKSEWPAIFGAMFFISASFMHFLIWTAYFFAISWLPWILILLEKYFSSRRVWLLMLAAFLAFQQFAICPQFFMYSMIFIGIYFSIIRRDVKVVKPLLAFFILTFSYSSIFLLPLREIGGLASRLNFISYNYFDISANKLSGIWQLILYKNSAEEFFYIYMGGLAISLIAIYLYESKSKIDWRLLIAAIAIFLFFSSGTLCQSIILLLPGLDTTRAYFRANEIVVFILIILLTKSIANYHFNLKRDMIITGAVAIISILVYLIKADFQTENMEQLATTLFYLIFFGLALLARSRNVLNDRTMIIIASILILLDMSRATRLFQNHQMRSYIITATGRLARSEWFWGPSPAYFTDNKSRILPDSFLPEDYNKFLLNHNYSAGSFSAEGGEFSPAVLKTYDDYLKASLINPNLLSLANVNVPGGYLPRSFTQKCYRVEVDDDSLLTKMQDKEFTGKDFVYLSNKPYENSLNENCKSVLMPIGANQNQDKIDFDPISNDQPTLLFISDNYYPGWNAYVNGQKSEIIRANYTFKAVALPPGKNEVIFKYEPKSFKIGGFVTWLSIISSLIYLAISSLWKRKNERVIKKI